MTLRGKKYALPKDDTLVADLQRTDTRPYEIVVLSGIFNEADAKIIASAASVKHFIVPELAAAYRAFNSLYKAGQKVSPESLAMEMESNGSMAREEASNVVDTLVSATPPRSIKHSIRALGRVQKRQAFYELVEYLRTPDALRDDLDGAMAHIQAFTSMAGTTSGRKVVSLTETMKRALERVGEERVWEPGLGEIDRYWKIRKGSYTVLAAQSGGGKSALLVNIALNIARGGTHVGIISIEMTADELTYRMAAIEARVDSSRIEDNLLEPFEKEAIANQLRINADIYDRVHVLDPSHVTAEELPGHYEELVKEYGCEVIFIDYIQRIGSKDRGVMGYERISRTSEVLTECTKSTGVATFALSVMARDKDSAKKGLDHLKGSGQIGHDASTVVIMTMDEVMNMSDPERSVTIESVKVRKGQPFIKKMILHGPTQRFYDPPYQPFTPTRDQD